MAKDLSSFCRATLGLLSHTFQYSYNALISMSRSNLLKGFMKLYLRLHGSAASILIDLATVDVREEYNDRYAVACNFIQAEKHCYQEVDALFGAGASGTIVRVSTGDMNTIISFEDIAAGFARARCP